MCYKQKYKVVSLNLAHRVELDWIEQCFTSLPTHSIGYMGVKRPNQQYQSTEGTYNTQITEKHNDWTHITKNTANPLVYINMG